MNKPTPHAAEIRRVNESASRLKSAILKAVRGQPSWLVKMVLGEVRMLVEEEQTEVAANHVFRGGPETFQAHEEEAHG